MSAFFSRSVSMMMQMRALFIERDVPLDGSCIRRLRYIYVIRGGIEKSGTGKPQSGTPIISVCRVGPEEQRSILIGRSTVGFEI